MKKLVGIVLLSVLSFTMIFAQSGELEIFSWWTGGGEEEAC